MGQRRIAHKKQTYVGIYDGVWATNDVGKDKTADILTCTVFVELCSYV